MPTNEERREVAARLRVLASHKAADEELVLDALGLYRGNNIEGFDTHCVIDLADLIEPEERTCTINHWNNASGVAFTRGECSECGGYLLENAVTYEPRPYCPHCGSKVVQE